MRIKSKILNILLITIGFLLIGVGTFAYGNRLAIESNMVVVSHSEYISNEIGQIIGKLYDFRGKPILANCNVTIYNPDKTIFLAPTPTDDTLEVIDGTHYINFTTPSTEGIYEYKIQCYFTLNNKALNRTISNSFHLSPALNTIRYLNSTLTGIVNNETFQSSILLQINSTTTTTLLNVTGIDSIVREIRETLFSDIDAFNNFTQIQSNFSVVNQKLDNIQYNISQITQYCSNPTTNSSQLCQLVYQINSQVNSINQTLDYVTNTQLVLINQTTSNIYDFLIVNVTNNFNSIFSSLSNIQTGIGQINSTVNSIQANITTVISNQEEIVYIDVVS